MTIAHNSKANGLIGNGNSHKPYSLVTLQFAESVLVKQFRLAQLAEVCNIGIWHATGYIKINAINGAIVRGRQLLYIPKRGIMQTNIGEAQYTISCSCAICEGTNLTLGKQLENEKRWVNPNVI